MGGMGMGVSSFQPKVSLAGALSALCSDVKRGGRKALWSTPINQRIKGTNLIRTLRKRSLMVRKTLAVLILVTIAVGWKTWSDTMSDPVVEHLTITSAKLAPGSEPITIALVADIHMAGPDMPPERVERIVALTNTLEPDIIAVAGDLVSEKRTGTRHYEPHQVIEPLGKLRAKDSVILVPGNHDHWYGWSELARELGRFPHITVMQNTAGQFGQLAIGGMDDDFTGNDDLTATLSAMEGLAGPRVMLTHTPDLFPEMPNDISLIMAGHTHCGQLRYPWGGSPVQMSEYGEKYACGVVKENGKTLVTSAGLGTSVLPVRFLTHPELWLIEIRPAS